MKGECREWRDSFLYGRPEYRYAKSTIIAQCLVNSNMIASIEQAEAAVRRIYEDQFQQGDFNQWNANVNDDWGAQMVRNVGRASTINVKKLIEDLT